MVWNRDLILAKNAGFVHEKQANEDEKNSCLK